MILDKEQLRTNLDEVIWKIEDTRLSTPYRTDSSCRQIYRYRKYKNTIPTRTKSLWRKPSTTTQR